MVQVSKGAKIRNRYNQVPRLTQDTNGKVEFILQSFNLITQIPLILKPLFYLQLSFSDDIVSTKVYDKRDEFDAEVVNFPFLDAAVPRSSSYGVFFSPFRFARSYSHVVDFNTRNKL